VVCDAIPTVSGESEEKVRPDGAFPNLGTYVYCPRRTSPV
jgi:hypothetical protein